MCVAIESLFVRIPRCPHLPLPRHSPTSPLATLLSPIQRRVHTPARCVCRRVVVGNSGRFTPEMQAQKCLLHCLSTPHRVVSSDRLVMPCHSSIPKHHLHIEAVADLWLFMRAQVFHHLPNLSGTFQGNGVLPVKLGVIPIHLRQTENFSTYHSRRFVAFYNANFKRLRDIESWVGLVILYSTSGVEEMRLFVKLDMCSSPRWIGTIPEQPEVCIENRDKVEGSHTAVM